jgi:hypothetical protein
MDNPVAYYRRQAESCVHLANSTSDPQSRVALLEVAQAWTHLAERAAVLRTLPDLDERSSDQAPDPGA